MAVTLKDKTCKLTLQVVTGEDAAGNDKYGTRTINNINPAVTDANLYGFAGGVAGLIKPTTSKMKRIDSGELTES